jgi:hypothetical protein
MPTPRTRPGGGRDPTGGPGREHRRVRPSVAGTAPRRGPWPRRPPGGTARGRSSSHSIGNSRPRGDGTRRGRRRPPSAKRGRTGRPARPVTALIGDPRMEGRGPRPPAPRASRDTRPSRPPGRPTPPPVGHTRRSRLGPGGRRSPPASGCTATGSTAGAGPRRRRAVASPTPTRGRRTRRGRTRPPARGPPRLGTRTRTGRAVAENDRGGPPPSGHGRPFRTGRGRPGRDGTGRDGTGRDGTGRIDPIGPIDRHPSRTLLVRQRRDTRTDGRPTAPHSRSAVDGPTPDSCVRRPAGRSVPWSHTRRGTQVLSAVPPAVDPTGPSTGRPPWWTDRPDRPTFLATRAGIGMDEVTDRTPLAGPTSTAGRTATGAGWVSYGWTVGGRDGSGWKPRGRRDGGAGVAPARPTCRFEGTAGRGTGLGAGDRP